MQHLKIFKKLKKIILFLVLLAVFGCVFKNSDQLDNSTNSLNLFKEPDNYKLKQENSDTGSDFYFFGESDITYKDGKILNGLLNYGKESSGADIHCVSFLNKNLSWGSCNCENKKNETWINESICSNIPKYPLKELLQNPYLVKQWTLSVFEWPEGILNKQKNLFLIK